MLMRSTLPPLFGDGGTAVAFARASDCFGAGFTSCTFGSFAGCLLPPLLAPLLDELLAGAGEAGVGLGAELALLALLLLLLPPERPSGLSFVG